jgi:hypothetical protein
LGKFWRVLQCKMFVYLTYIRTILRPLDIFYGHLVYFMVILFISPRFGVLHKEKSGSPADRY